MDGVRKDIRLSTLNIPSILFDVSNRDFNTIGQTVSSCKENDVKSNFSTKPFETLLIVDPESSRHLACEVKLEIFTRTVCKSTRVFCLKMAVNEDLEVVASLGVVLGDGFLSLFGGDDRGGDGDRDLEVVERRSFTSLGLTCNKVWWNLWQCLHPLLEIQVPLEWL